MVNERVMYSQNSTQLYAQLVARAKEKAAFADFDGQTVSYVELYSAVMQLAGLFRQKGVKHQDTVLVISKDEIQVSLLFLAALFEGIVPVILSSDTREPRVQSIISRVNPKIVFADTNYREEWSWLNELTTLFLKKSDFAASAKGFLSKFRGKKTSYFPGVTDDVIPLPPRCSAKAEDTAYLLFSSGTTSLPKGIAITHGALFSHLSTIQKVFGYSTQSVICNNLDLAHADGLIQGPFLALYTGALLYRPEQFAIHNLETVLNRAYSKKVSHFITVPTILSLMDRLLVENDYFDDESFQVVVSVAGKLDANLWSRIQDRFNVRVCNVYGLSETVAGGLFCGPSDETFRVGTVGKPIDVETRIVDKEGRECETGVEGELLLKGDSVFTGYLDNPEADAEAFVGGWLRTGDIAIQDSDGFYSIVGRKKSVIVSGGFNIHPDEVTEVLNLHDKIDESATVGIQDNEWGEIVISGYCSRENLSEDDLMEHCRHYLEKHKVPKKIVKLPSLPRTLSGKVMIQELQEVLSTRFHEGGDDTGVVCSENDVLRIASKVFKTSVKNISVDLPPSDIPGWDSLNHLNLITAVEEHFSIELTVYEMMSVDSLGRLQNIIHEKTQGRV